nr:MAG: Isoleucyl-tRNA synthetase [Candidatus Nanosalinarum sp. J07AB56]
MTGYSPQEIHESVQNHWEEENVREKVRESTEGNEPFFMVDGPPYLNGAPHVGHMQGKVLKDVHLRYRQMQGYDVWDQAGFDTHGLPNELATEEELGIENKNEIGDRISSAEFIRRCKERATSAQDLWKDTMWDLAIWQDFENPYLTYEPEYIESEWWLVKQADEQDLIYQAEKPIHWCPRCQTSLSGYEVTDEYQEVEDTAVYAKFPLENREEKLVIWTTTPWTIPANMTVFVHPDYRYAVVDTGDKKLVIAEQLVGEVMESAGVEEYEIERELSGADLKGLKYEHPLMEEVPRQRELDEEDGVHRVQTSDSLVTMEEGTGLVHAATGHGQEDYQEAKPLGLPVFSPVDDDGNYTAEAGVYEGEYVHEVNERIATDLDDRNLLLLSYGFEHEYPHCWRCESKLVLRATPQWFIRNEETKQRMLEENQEVDWLPESAQTRFANFIEESPDWCISRQNYWGTPLPIWVNDETGEHRVIGSFDELEDEVGELPEDFDPHKHQADKLTWEDEDGTWRRVPDVMDVWFDSGSAPFASLHYPFEEEPFESMFPMDFITESSDQIRGWFYTTMFCGILGFDQSQYDQVLFQSHVLRADGGKMSKSSGSTIHPDDQVEKYGADLPRFYSLRVAPPWENTKYNEERDRERDIPTVQHLLQHTPVPPNIRQHRHRTTGRPGKRGSLGSLETQQGAGGLPRFLRRRRNTQGCPQPRGLHYRRPVALVRQEGARPRQVRRQGSSVDPLTRPQPDKPGSGAAGAVHNRGTVPRRHGLGARRGLPRCGRGHDRRRPGGTHGTGSGDSGAGSQRPFPQRVQPSLARQANGAVPRELGQPGRP